MQATSSSPVNPEQDRLLRGAGRYIGDLRQPGQLWARIVRSNQAHGRIVSIDVEAARAQPGVHAVLTAQDLDEVPTIPIRVREYDGMVGRQQPIIAHDHVRYVGEPLAIVVADDQYLAEDAAEEVLVEIDPLPAIVDPLLAQEQTHFDDGRTGVLADMTRAHGDTATYFSTAHLVLEEELTVQRHTGLPMETRGLVAEWTDGELHVWGPTKYIHATRNAISRMFGLEPQEMVIHRVDVGGMFGVRGEVYPEDFLVPWASRVLGRPVAWIEDRVEHLTSINHARDQHHRFRMAVDSDGTLLAFEDHVTVDMGAYPRPIGGRVLEMTADDLPGPYAWKAFDIGVTGVATSKTPVGTMRGPGAFEANFVRERMIDLAAAKLGLDPVELRRRNLIPGDAMPWVFELDGGDIHYDSGDLPAGFDQALEAFDLPGLREQVSRRRAQGELVGIGIGLFMEPSGGGTSEDVIVRIDTDGRWVVGTSAADIGQGLHDMLRTVVANELGIAPRELEISSGTTVHEGGNGTYGSRTTIFAGGAAVAGTREIERSAREKAATQLGADPDDLRIDEDGFQHGADRLFWKELGPLEAVGRLKGPLLTHGFGLHLAVVSVDAGTGGVDVEQLAVAYDAGVVVDLATARTQLEGATVQALGGALFEELAYGPDGQPQSTTFIGYLVPTAAETPKVRSLVMELAPAPGNPLGAKGVGEAGMAACAPAVANAIAEALGATGSVLLSLPLKPGHVLDAVDDAAGHPTS